MVIAVNTRLLIKNKLEGIGWVTYETLKRITKWHPEHKFIFIFDRKYDSEFIFWDNIIPEIVRPPARHPLLWYMFFDWGVPGILNKYKADLFLSPDGWLSLRTKVASLPIIHDLNFFAYPDFVPFHVRKYYEYFFPRFVRKATRIATVSEYTKNDIHSRFNYDPGKIDVINNGVNEEYKPIDNKLKEIIKIKYTGGCPYFLFVGLIHKRKNLANIIKAFEQYKLSANDSMKLLIVGEKKWMTGDIKEAIANCKFQNDLIFADRLNIDELKYVMAAAVALVYVSFFEGFGLPILEAMYCDIPVVTSNVTSMPEVGKDAVLYADPNSVESISNAMYKIVKDDITRKNLIERSKVQREKYNWDITAKRLWNSIEKIFK